MAKVYQIEIEETLQKVVKVKANSLAEAINKVDERYSNEEYVLNENDYKGVEFREKKEERIKNKKSRER